MSRNETSLPKGCVTRCGDCGMPLKTSSELHTVADCEWWKATQPLRDSLVGLGRLQQELNEIVGKILMSRSATSRREREDDAHRLHQAGYSRRAVWAKWALDDFKALYERMTDDLRPLEDDGKLDPSFYLDATEWCEVARAAEGLANTARLVATCRELGTDE